MYYNDAERVKIKIRNKRDALNFVGFGVKLKAVVTKLKNAAQKFLNIKDWSKAVLQIKAFRVIVKIARGLSEGFLKFVTNAMRTLNKIRV